jgi:curved DNA-binding protein CbpA
MTKTKRLVVEKGYYEILEVSPSSTTVEIQRSFERLCDENVDLNTEDNDQRRKSAETLFTLTKAYEILTDPFQRINYDERKFGGKTPINNEVETIFREGLRYFRANDIESAVRFFKESVYLFPHRALYRVHLAIAYGEKGWKEYTEKELRMALSLDPENEFAQEATAKLLFKVSDKKIKSFFSQKINRQLTAVYVGVFLLTGTLFLGTPAIKKYFHKMTSNEMTEKEKIAKAEKIKSSLPKDFLEAMEKQKNKQFEPVNKYKPIKTTANNTTQTTDSIPIIQKITEDVNIVPSNKEYIQNIPIKRTFYKGQNLIVVEYKNGKMMSYSPQNLVGWKEDPELKTPVLITKSNEFIPVSKEIPINLPNGSTLSPQDENFPKESFPEYELSGSSNNANEKLNTDDKKETPIPENKVEQTNNNVDNKPNLPVLPDQATIGNNKPPTIPMRKK